MSRTPRFSSKLAYDFHEGCVVLVRTEFFEAAANNDLETIKKCIGKGYDINTQDSDDELVTALHVASRNGYTDMTRLLLEKGADVDLGDCYGHTPLFFACEHGHADVVRLLLEAGADPAIRETENNETPEERLRTSCRAPARERILRLLRKHQTVPNNEGHVGPRPGM